MAGNRRGGICFLKIDGVQQELKGNFSYRPKFQKKTAIKGNGDIHGYKEETMEPYIEGEFTDSAKVDLNKLVKTTDAVITLQVANGKTFILREAWYAGDGIVGTDEGNIAVRFEGKDGEEMPE